MTEQSKGGLERWIRGGGSPHQQQRVKEGGGSSREGPSARGWPAWVMAAGIVCGLAVLLLVGKLTLTPLSNLLRALAFCCVLLLLIPFRYTAWRLGLENLEWVLLNVLGIGPLAFSTALLLNWAVHSEVQCSTLRIKDALITDLFFRVELEGGRFEAFPGAREFAADPQTQLQARSLRMCTARGLLGVEVVNSRELLDH